ncbi:energy transducer TonB [Sinomicrobium kalidii]|uniref:energy transducer TonB n=1 Tax=Sinomicrobium kalidii TaxID=2900738 RepID=UPI001E56A158|nr:energy transducer TonB [Sinomicrobium kalidii]UGU17524.1 energy transducer TonB [Sinomicrobium kalidii]
MSFLDTRHKKKSFTLTTVLLAILVALLFYLGISYMDPPPESGITVNLGFTEYGAGDVQPVEQVKSAPEEETQEEQPEETVTEPEPTEAEEPQEEVLTDDTEDAPVISPEEKKKPVTEKKTEPVKEKPREEPKPKKPSKSTTDALSSILNGPKTEGTENTGEGDDTRAGDKGNPEGDPYASSYYGSPGTGSGGVGYGLSGRSLLSRGKVQQDCNEEGRVVVKIEVDKNGNVIDAVPGVKGTTNNHPCLLEPAKKTALMFKWNPDSDAPSRQIGFVVINFRLGD